MFEALVISMEKTHMEQPLGRSNLCNGLIEARRDANDERWTTFFLLGTVWIGFWG